MAFSNHQMMKEPGHVPFVEKQTWLLCTWSHFTAAFIFTIFRLGFSNYTNRFKVKVITSWKLMIFVSSWHRNEQTQTEYIIFSTTVHPKNATMASKLYYKTDFWLSFKVSFHRHWGSILTSHHQLVRDTFPVFILAVSVHQPIRGYLY